MSLIMVIGFLFKMIKMIWNEILVRFIRMMEVYLKLLNCVP